MKKQILLIPAYNPKIFLIGFIQQLLEKPFLQIIVVNDGSDESSTSIFEQLQQLERVTVLTHARNEGKGIAVKTGIAYILKTYQQFQGIVTVGADGQHEIEDVELICNSTRIFGNSFIVGVRDFKTKNMPRLRYVTYQIASLLFDIYYKKRLTDVQSGIRYLPREHLNWLVNSKGKGYEYDAEMLIEAINRGIQIYEVPIGKAKMTQNEFLQYDGVYHPMMVMKRFWKKKG